MSVGTVKNLSSQYIYTHALQALAVPDMQDLIMAGAHAGCVVACVYIFCSENF